MLRSVLYLKLEVHMILYQYLGIEYAVKCQQVAPGHLPPIIVKLTHFQFQYCDCSSFCRAGCYLFSWCGTVAVP